jgi:hypothetical protein
MLSCGLILGVVIPLDRVKPVVLFRVIQFCWSRILIGYALFVKCGSNGVVSFTMISVVGF